METIRVIFGRSKKPISYTIRFVTGGQYSHVAAILPCGQRVVESVGGIGVVITPLSAFKARYSTWEESIMPCRSSEYAYSFMQSQVGKPYDYAAFWAIPFRKPWNYSNRWICSELIAAATQLYRPSAVSTITPHHNYILSWSGA